MPNRIEAWKQFLSKSENHWQKLILNQPPIYSGCGAIYELENFLHDPNEDFAIVDMRNIAFAEPYYHPNAHREIYIVLQGTACIVLGYKEFQVTLGDIVVIPSNTSHFTIPDKNFVIAVINTPPYKPDHYIPLSKSDSIVSFDYNQFCQLIGKVKTRELLPIENTTTDN